MCQTLLKTCLKCNIAKPLEHYSKNRSKCKPCRAIEGKEYRKTDAAKAVEKRRALTPKRKTWRAKYKVDNAEKIRKWDRERYQRDKPKRIALVYKRKLMKIQRVPIWYDKADDRVMANLIEIQNMLKVLSLSYHIDHIIPLQGELVSGLHCKENWQLLSAKENLTKSNTFDPETFNQN